METTHCSHPISLCEIRKKERDFKCDSEFVRRNESGCAHSLSLSYSLSIFDIRAQSKRTVHISRAVIAFLSRTLPLTHKLSLSRSLSPTDSLSLSRTHSHARTLSLSCARAHARALSLSHILFLSSYGVATTSRLLKTISLFCKRAL